MKHIFRSRRRIIDYYETKILEALDNQRKDLKKQSDKDLLKQKIEFEERINRLISDNLAEKRVLMNEQYLKLILESKRVENEVLKLIRELNKQNQITKDISDTRDALHQIFAHAKVIKAAIETKTLNDRVESAVYLNLLGALGNLEVGMEEGKVVIPHADVVKGKG